MANRFPLIVDSSALQIKEIPNGDNLDLTGNSIVNVVDITASGNLSVGGTLTYSDVTNIDSVGLITARSGINATGVVTATSFVKTGGTASQFLKADGSSDGTTYLSAETQTLNDVLGLGNTSTTGLSVGVVTTTALKGFDYLQAPHGTTVNYAVTVASKTAAHRYQGSGSSNGYVIDGVESPFLTLTPGRTYRFTLSSSDMTSHPFRFYLEADKTTAYTTNVTSTATYTEVVVTDSTPSVLHYQCSAHSLMGNAVNTNSGSSTTGETATFYGGLAEKYEKAGTTLGSQTNNPLTDGNIILFTGNESGNKTINFTGVHAQLSDGETCSFTVILTPNGSGVINVVQVDGQAITVKWAGGSAPSAGSSGQDIYTFQILKTGTGTSDYTVFGAATNYA